MRKQATAQLENQATTPPLARTSRRKEPKIRTDVTPEIIPQDIDSGNPGLPVVAWEDSNISPENIDESPMLGVDRQQLQREMIEMRQRYRDGALEAASNIDKFEQLSSKLKSLLDEEFPGWETADDSDNRSSMVTLYFQYKADAERAAVIQEKFERLSNDLEALLREEFPGYVNS
jgi:hypothetical protein